MKLLPFILINLATVGGALVVYDQMRAQPASSALVLERNGADTTSLEERLEALEAERRPTLVSEGIDPRILERLESLERGMAAAAPAPDPGAPRTDDDPRPVGQPDDRGGPQASRAAAPTDEDIKRFRKLQAAARKQEGLEKARAWVDQRLDKLALNLSPNQREAVHAAHVEFRPRIGQIWGEAKAAARETIAQGREFDQEQFVAETQLQINQEFAATLTDVVPVADAEAMAEVLTSRK